jgi:hypothetical protein
MNEKGKIHDISGQLHEKTPSVCRGELNFQNFIVKDYEGELTRYTTYNKGIMETLSTMVEGDKLTVYFKISGKTSSGGAFFNNLFAQSVKVGN